MLTAEFFKWIFSAWALDIMQSMDFYFFKYFYLLLKICVNKDDRKDWMDLRSVLTLSGSSLGLNR